MDVLYEDNHLLVLNKPSLIATMGAAPGEPSLVDDAKAYLRKKYNKPGNVFLGVVSRLDSHVSGAIIFARTSKSASRISKQFHDRSIEKRYWAIVEQTGIPGFGKSNSGKSKSGKSKSGTQDRCTLENWVVKDDAARRMRCVRGVDGGKSFTRESAKRARLHYRVIGQDLTKNRTLLEVQLETGRKHQIRVQLAKAGMPILGDRKYNSDQPFPVGIALHCRSLQLRHPTKNEPLSFEAEVPKFWNIANYVL